MSPGQQLSMTPNEKAKLILDTVNLFNIFARVQWVKSEQTHECSARLIVQLGVRAAAILLLKLILHRLTSQSPADLIKSHSE